MTTPYQAHQFERIKQSVNRHLASITTDEKQQEIADLNDSLITVTPDQIAATLEATGLRRNSRSLHDYRVAKKLIFRGFLINPVVYDRTIKMVIDYLGV